MVNKWTKTLDSNFRVVLTDSKDFDCICNDLLVANYTDETNPYVVANNTVEVLENGINIRQRLITWFANNQRKENHGKCHLLLRTQEDANIQIANTTISCSRSQKLLGIVFNNKPKFYKHIENICQKGNIKLNLLATVINYTELPRKSILMNAFFKT